MTSQFKQIELILLRSWQKYRFQSLKHRPGLKFQTSKAWNKALSDSWFLRLCNEKVEKVLKTVQLQLLVTLRKFVLNLYL